MIKLFLTSSLGKKLIMALSGLFLCTFLIVHLIGNIYLYVGRDAFNGYVELMTSNWLIRFLEIGLFAGFIIHIIQGIAVSLENRASRPQKYDLKKTAGMSTIASRYMIISGSIVFIFLVIHLQSFWYTYKFGTPPASTTMFDLVVSTFQDPIYSLFYVIAMVLLGFHLAHGFQSAFRTLGLNHSTYSRWIQCVGYGFSILITGAFSSFPIYFCFIQP